MLNEILAIVDKIKVNKRNGEYAVYKPLLLLIIFNEVLSGAENEFKFKDIHIRLASLMEKYGWETISKKRAEYPFHFLASSELWETNIDKSKLKHPDSPSKAEMENAIGKINSRIYDYLIKNPGDAKTVIDFVYKKFPALERVISID